MPRTAQAANPAALEAALPPSLRAALAELKELFNVWPGGWPDTPLGPVFSQAAVLYRAREIVRSSGVGARAALLRAASELGVAYETARSRGRRWPAVSRDGATCTLSGAGRRVSVDEDAVKGLILEGCEADGEH